MARKQSGGAWNRLLNLIGLVDDEDTRDTYGEEYQNGNYGRQGSYTPSRASGSATSQRRGLPQPRPGRNDSRSTRASRERDDAGYESYSSRRSGSRFDGGSDFNDYDARTDRQSRFDAAPQPRRASSPNVPQPAPRMRVSRRSRTVMYSLHALEDCCDVIDQLIANNTVVLTMDELDGHLLQRAVDTLSGAVFALHASIRKASDRTYLIAPQSVEVNDSYTIEHSIR